MKIDIVGQIERLKNLGFDHAADGLRVAAERQRKLALAYEHYRFVRKENVDAFNAMLRAAGMNMKDPFKMEYQVLDFTPVGNYERIPPEHVLISLETARGRNCFDSYEVAFIRNVKDPLLFGRITDCPDRFFIDEWGDDVSITDLLEENEG